MKKTIKKHYHWIIAALVFLEMIVFGGLLNSSGVYVQPVSSDFGISTTTLAVAGMPYTVLAFISTCFSGFLFSCYGYKKAAIVSLLLVSSALALSSAAGNIFVYGVGRALYGIGRGAIFTAGAVWLIKNWFRKHQGAVLGAVTMASGLGGSLMTVLQTHIIETANWRSAQLTMAAILAGIALLYFLLKDRPEQMDLLPYGYGAAEEANKKVRAENRFRGYPLKEQLKRPLFYLMCLCTFFGSACLLTTSIYVVPHFRSQGFTAYEAAAYQSVFMLTLAAAKLLIGIAHDRYGAKFVMIVCMLCGAVGQAILAYTTNPLLCYAAMMIFAVGLCMTSLSIPLISASLFGYEGCQSVNGIFLGLASLSNLLASPISGLSYDAYGSYVPIYRITSFILLGILGIYLLMFSMARKEQEKTKE